MDPRQPAHADDVIRAIPGAVGIAAGSRPRAGGLGHGLGVKAGISPFSGGRSGTRYPL